MFGARVGRSARALTKLVARLGPRRAAENDRALLRQFTAINDAMRIALATDRSALVFGEDVAFGGVFRCTVGLRESFGAESSRRQRRLQKMRSGSPTAVYV